MGERTGLVKLVLMLSSLFVSSTFADELMINTAPAFKYKYFSISKYGKELAYVDENCKIVYNVKVGFHIQTELERYKGICEDMKAIVIDE